MSTIERDNRLLLEKMSQIIRTRGRVDNKNYYSYKRFVDNFTFEVFQIKSILLINKTKEL